MNKNLIYIRSNTFSKLNIDKAKRMLVYSFPDIVFTEPIISVPANQTGLPFRNILGSFECENPLEEVIDILQSVEYSIALKPRHKANIQILMEIELIQHGDTTLNTELMESKTVQSLFKDLDY